VLAQTQVLRFEDFPAMETFKGKPAQPKLVRPEDRKFGTVIREGASNGPNFAGTLTIASWGCGGGCISMALVNAKDGTIYKAPFKALAWGTPDLKYEGKYDPSQEKFEPLAYKLNSRLLIVRGCPEEENCASYFYEWKDGRLETIRRIPVVPAKE
jgi:hypothetical protein